MTTLPGDDPLLASVPVVEGYKVLGPCLLLEKVGEGGMGAVYRGLHLNLNVEVAVKCLLPGLVGEDQEFVIRFHREAQAAASITHQNLIRVYDVSEDSGLHYMIMEFVSGSSLSRRVKSGGALPLPAAWKVVRDAAAGLQDAHAAGIVHRDIKPANIMISSRGVVKVADLGLSKDLEVTDHMTLSRHFLGTPRYASPEQFDDSRLVRPASDVWSLAMTFYYLLLGRPAIQAKSFLEIARQVCMEPVPSLRNDLPDLPEEVYPIMERCLERDLSRRTATAGELYAAMRRLALPEADLRAAEDLGGDVGAPQAVLPAEVESVRRALERSGRRSPRASSRPEASLEARPGPPARPAGASRPVTTVTTVILVAAALLLASAFVVWKLKDRTDDRTEDRGEIAEVSRAPERGGPSPSVPDAATSARLDAAQRLLDLGQHEPALEAFLEVEREDSTRPGLRTKIAICRFHLAERAFEAGALDAAARWLSRDDRGGPGLPQAEALQLRLQAALDSRIQRAFTWSEPPEGALLTTASIPLRGELVPGVLARIRVGDVEQAIDAEADGVELSVEASGDGEHTLRVELFDAAGTTHQVARTVRIDSTPPTIESVEPEDDSWVTRSPVAVTVRVSDEGSGIAEVRIDGEAAIEREGAFQRHLTLADGIHEIALDVRDRAGHVTSRRVRWKADSRPLEVVIDSPAPAARLTRDAVVDVAGRATPGCRLRLDGKEVPVEPDGAFRTRLYLPEDGAHDFALEIESASGRNLPQTLTLTRKASPPRLRFEVPAEGASLAARRVLVRGTLEDPLPCTVTVNGQPAELDGGSWSAEVTLSTGPGAVEVVARDSLGNRSELRREVEVMKPVRKIRPSWARISRDADHDPASGLPLQVTDRASGLELVLVPAGSYWMGASAGDDEAAREELPRHLVAIERPFYLGKYEVTNAEYLRFVPDHDSGFFLGYRLNEDAQPVVRVSWEEARAFCAEYDLRLPTEAEWEYAHRAGTATRFPWGEDAALGEGRANVLDDPSRPLLDLATLEPFPFADSFAVSARVGSFPPNAFGLHDTAGNVWEWCADAWTPAYDPASDTPPAGEGAPTYRVARGGAWNNSPWYCRSSRRFRFFQQDRDDAIGFRVARDP